MKIPAEADARLAFYQQTKDLCFQGRDLRAGFYREMRSYYLWGSSTSDPQAPYDKIKADINLLYSFLFAAETTRFSIAFDGEIDPVHLAKVRPMARRILKRWHQGNGDIMCGQAILWSLIFGSMMLKLVWRPDGVHYYLVEPHDFGVLREGHGFLDGQEAMAHRYTIRKSELEMQLRAAGHPNVDYILANVSATAGKTEELPQPMLAVAITKSSPTMQGAIAGVDKTFGYVPEQGPDMVDMTDLWIWNDDLNDFQTVTMAEPNLVIYDRQNVFLKGSGEHPFVKITPLPAYNYFWGYSEVDAVVNLQDWRSERLWDIRKLLKKQIDPPILGIGLSGIQDEKLKALHSAGGRLSVPSQGGSAQEFKPTVPADVFKEMGDIDAMQNDLLNLRPIQQGKGTAGVRSKEHADLLARISSSPVKQTALVIEDALEQVATKTLLLEKRHDDRPILMEPTGEAYSFFAKLFKTTKPLQFMAADFPEGGTVKIDGHSSSPIFVEDQRELAFTLLKARSIKRESLLRMVSPPDLDVLLDELKDIEKEEAQAAQVQMQLAAEKHPGGRAK